MFEVRGHPQREHRGQALAPKRTSAGVTLAYVGEDEQFRETAVTLDPPPDRFEIDGQRVTAGWPVRLGAGAALRVLVTVDPHPVAGPPRRRRMERAVETVAGEREKWRAQCTRIETDSELFGRIVEASMRDLHALSTPLDDGRGTHGHAITAGIPWFVALFGRDSLITCHQTLILNPTLARDNLRLLARFQARTDDPWRDAEPGKILHELRAGELARAGLIPHTPYYGTVDATALFLVLAGSYFRWTHDLETLAELRPALDAALGWIDEFGDLDGDGFLEYERRSPAGLLNQGWKDSEDCIVHRDGSLAEGSIALVEVQGYAYLAKQRIADVYGALGDPERAETLRREARELKRAFNEAFWDPEEGMFVLALDGRKRQVRSVTSNPGHCLYCGIVDSDKAPRVAERLMAGDMFCGWGLRTLSSGSPAFNPMSYHNGSVWPHDNAIAAAGMKRYGFNEHTERIATVLFEVAADMRDHRLPELYCGFDREERPVPVAYPVACSPQAWAAGVPFMLLQAMLGISANAEQRVLTVNEPRLPDWLSDVRLDDMCVHDSRVSLAFRREAGLTSFSLPEQSRDVQVLLIG
jgi:glycogen debranching enzyme